MAPHTRPHGNLLHIDRQFPEEPPAPLLLSGSGSVSAVGISSYFSLVAGVARREHEESGAGQLREVSTGILRLTVTIFRDHDQVREILALVKFIVSSVGKIRA